MTEKVRIYQLYFKEEQRDCLLPEFTPYDNTENLTPALREYPSLKKCWEISKRDGVELWGGVSWNWGIKFTDWSPQAILDHITSNPGHDVYFLNSFTSLGVISYNVWEQGHWCHPHILEIAEHLLPIMGYNKNILYQPMDRNTIFWGSMAIGNEKFWSEYFAFAELFVSAIPKLPPDILKKFHGDNGYTDNSIGYFSFIHERLMSTFVWMNRKRYSILPFNMHEQTMEPELFMLSALKSIAIERNDPNMLRQWAHYRYWEKERHLPNSEDLASGWIAKLNMT